MEWFSFILAVYIGSYLVPITIYYLTLKYQAQAMVFLALMLIAGVLIDGIGFTSAMLTLGVKVNAMNNYYGLFEIAIVSKFYQTQILSTRKWPFAVLALANIVAQLMEMFVFRSPDLFSGTSRTIFATTVTIYALVFFFRVMKNPPAVHIYYTPMFWINIGMLLYFTGNLFLFMMEYYLVQVMKNDLTSFWLFHNLMGILANILFAIGFWQTRKHAVTVVPNQTARTTE